jgi:hypothetical protein
MDCWHLSTVVVEVMVEVDLKVLEEDHHQWMR